MPLGFTVFKKKCSRIEVTPTCFFFVDVKANIRKLDTFAKACKQEGIDEPITSYLSFFQTTHIPKLDNKNNCRVHMPHDQTLALIANFLRQGLGVLDEML